MTRYRIESEAGIQLGIYDGANPAAAIHAMNADAGESDLDRNDGLIVKALLNVYTKDDMRGISLGIAAEMAATDTAELIGTNGKQGDARVIVFELRGVRVAVTNGDPIWEESDAVAFAELLETEGIEL